MGIKSINEPDGPGNTTMFTPVSINEPPNIAVPVISTIAPDECTVGQPDFTLFISGSGFDENSVIVFAGHDEPTTLNEDGTLSTGVKPSLWAEPVVVQCMVRNGPLLSGAVDFTFAAEAAPSSRTLREDDFRPTHSTHRRKGR